MDDFKWDADKMLNHYIHDYMLKKKLHKAAQTFRNEANLTSQTVAIDCPEGFLLDWWSIFYDTYCYRERQAKELSHENALKGQQVMDINQDCIRPWLQQYEMNQPRLGQLTTEVDFANMPAAAKIYEDRLRHPFSKTLPPDTQLVDDGKMTSHKSMIPSLGNVQQQVCAETQQHSLRGGRKGVGLSRSHPVEPTLYGVPKAMIPITGPSESELNKGVSSMPLSGWPLAGIDQIPPGLGKQVLKSHLQISIEQQFQILAGQHRQELTAQSLTDTPLNLMTFLLRTYADLDLRRLMLLNGGLNVKDAQMSGGVDSQQIIASSIEAVSKTGGTVPKDEMMFRMRHTTDQQQQQFQLQKQELPKRGRKRKELSYSGAASGHMAGNTPGTYAESLMALYDKISTPVVLSQNYRTSGKLNADGCDRTGLAEISGKDGRHGMAEASSDVNVESFLSHDTDIDDLRGTPFSTLLQSSTACNRIAPKDYGLTGDAEDAESRAVSKGFKLHSRWDAK